MPLDISSGLGNYTFLLEDHLTPYAFILTSKNQNTAEFIRLINYVHKEHPIGTLLIDQDSGQGFKEFRDYLQEAPNHSLLQCN